MNKASIIIPYYKKKKFIKRTLISILKQSYKNFEIIIIYDDEDKTDLNLIKNLKKLDKRIKVYINKKNIGAGLSRNIGIKKAKGYYICFLDADDLWRKNKLNDQIKFMIKKNYSITHTSYDIIDMNANLIGSRKAKTYKSQKKLLRSCDIGLSTVVIKKDIFSKNLKFAKIKTKEDFVLWLKILGRGINIYAFDRNLVKWTQTKNSLSSSTIQKLKDSYSVYNHYMKFSFTKSLYYTLILSLNYLKKSFL